MPARKHYVCSIEGCEKPHQAKGWCTHHYNTNRNHGSPTYFEDLPPKDPICKEESCGDASRIRGYCKRHYLKARWKKTIEVERRSSKKCEMCSKPYYAKGYCVDHYAQFRYHGDPCRRDRRRKGSGHTNKKGYRHIYVDGKRIQEHRHVMEKHLGRPLEPYENIHHINGRKDDNRLDNLELWSTSQSPGQRVTDKLGYALAILDKYQSLVDAGVL